MDHSAQMYFCQELKSPPRALCETWRLFPSGRFRAGMDFLTKIYSDVKPKLNVGTLETFDATKICQNKR